MKLGIFGAGYVGLVTAVCFAERGHEVYVHDIAKEKIATLQSGGLPIFEEGLETLLRTHQDKLHFTHESSVVADDCDVLFICVGTPQHNSGEADLSQVESAVEEICSLSSRDKSIIIKSTVPPGTTERLAKEANLAHEKTFTFAHNPEFLRQGKAVQDFKYPSRIIIGTNDSRTKKLLNKIYSDWNAPVLETDIKTSELLKYAANSFLAMKITYMNMLAQLSDKLGTNIDDIASGIGMDPRIGQDFLKAGIGFGGSCFPKDLAALQHVASKEDMKLPLIEQTSVINEEQGKLFFEKIKSFFKDLQGKKIALLGLSFKPLTDDTRSAPSIPLCERLVHQKSIVTAFDPLVRSFPVDEVKLASSLKEAIEDCDAVIIVTEWPEFNWVLHEKFLRSMKRPVIFDGRNMFSVDKVRTLSESIPLYYESIGRLRINSLTASPNSLV